MTTYLEFNEVWTIVKDEQDEAKLKPKENIKAYLILESQCEVETRRSYLEDCGKLGWKAWKALREGYLATTAISKPYIRKQLRLLRLNNFEDIRTFMQKYKELIRVYNGMAGAEAPNSKETDLIIGGKDKITIVEVVDLICDNLSSNQDEFTT